MVLANRRHLKERWPVAKQGLETKWYKIKEEGKVESGGVRIKRGNGIR
jgi:hypothetical protein